MNHSLPLPIGVEIRAEMTPEFATILTPQALGFIAKLARKFEGRRRELMATRARRQAELDTGKLPDFLQETKHIRETEWTVAPAPRDLLDRRVEITGPTDRKLVINALNSGANVFMADFEDSNTPTWLAQVGLLASSKSAMKPLAPELSALITSLRSVGPVISTRRSS